MKGFSGFKRVDPYADQKAAKQDYYKKEKDKKENYYKEKKGVEKEPEVNTRKKFKDTKVGKFIGVGQGDKRKVNRAKRLIRKNVGNTTVDSPVYNERKFKRSDRKVNKAVDLLRKTGKSEEEIEIATGAGGYKPAIEYARKKKKKK